jgi:hypothetical protein
MLHNEQLEGGSPLVTAGKVSFFFLINVINAARGAAGGQLAFHHSSLGQLLFLVPILC